MKIRVLDFESFDHTLDLPANTTIGSLGDLIRSNFNYDVSRCAFYHKGTELPPDLVISPDTFPEGSVVVLFNSQLFPEKSFPTVDGAFKFFPSRFQNYAIQLSPPEDIEGGSAGSRWGDFLTWTSRRTPSDAMAGVLESSESEDLEAVRLHFASVEREGPLEEEEQDFLPPFIGQRLEDERFLEEREERAMMEAWNRMVRDGRDARARMGGQGFQWEAGELNQDGY